MNDSLTLLDGTAVTPRPILAYHMGLIQRIWDKPGPPLMAMRTGSTVLEPNPGDPKYLAECNALATRWEALEFALAVGEMDTEQLEAFTKEKDGGRSKAAAVVESVLRRRTQAEIDVVLVASRRASDPIEKMLDARRALIGPVPTPVPGAEGDAPAAAAEVPESYGITAAYLALRTCERLGIDPIAFDKLDADTQAKFMAYEAIRRVEEARERERVVTVRAVV